MSLPTGERVLEDFVRFAFELREADDDKVWGRVLDKLAADLDCEAGTYWRFLPEKKWLAPKHAIGPNADDLKGTPVDIRTGIAGWCASHREPVLVEDAYKDERFLKEVDAVTGFRSRTVLAYPILDRLDLFGVIQLFNKRAGGFNRADMDLVEASVRVVALAVRNLKLEAAVEKVSARNASILENLSGGFIAVDLHGRLLMCNPAARRILDLPQDLKLNVPIEQALFACPRMADVLVDTLAKRKTEKRKELVWSKKGEERTIGYSTILIQDTKGELTGAGVTFQDITAAKEAA